MNTEQAALLREAVTRAAREWESHPDNRDRHSGGTWAQGSWGTIDPAVVTEEAGWDPFDDEHFLVGPPAITCGTTGCLAGHLAALTGWRMLVEAEDVQNPGYTAESPIEITRVYHPATGRTEHIMEAGYEALGSSAHDTDWVSTKIASLFSGANTLVGLIERADDLLSRLGHPGTGLNAEDYR